MKKFSLMMSLSFLLMIACQSCGSNSEPAVPSPEESAKALSMELMLIDTHIDAPLHLKSNGVDISVRAEAVEFDYERAVEGGLNAAFMSIFVPASYQESGGGRAFADELIDLVEELERSAPDRFVIARSTADVEAAFNKGLVALPLGIENGAALEGDLASLQHFYDRGVRYMTLTHGENNAIGDSSYAKEKKWNGLSPLGKSLIPEMNRLGIMIDISHVTDETFYDVLELTKVPVFASHSSCRQFTPGWERNMADDMIKALAENGGVLQINFGNAFLDDEFRVKSEKLSEEVRAHAKDMGWGRESPELMEYYQQKTAEAALPVLKAARVAAHIKHVVDLVGIDHVGIGSDFDGVGGQLPEDLKDVSQYPNLAAELIKLGFSKADIGKVWSGNLMRVWRDVEAHRSL